MAGPLGVRQNEDRAYDHLDLAFDDGPDDL